MTNSFNARSTLKSGDRNYEIWSLAALPRDKVARLPYSLKILLENLLRQEDGRFVHAKDIEFWMERTPEKSHGGATGFTPPPGVVVKQIPADKSIGSMMLAGKLDAALHYLSGRNLVDRSRADLAGHPDFKYLFPDPVAEGVRYYRKTGLFPINHQAVVRRDIFDKEPWVVLNLVKAFNRANEIANAQRLEHVDYHLATGLLAGDAKTPVLHHGVKANRKVIETIAQYSLEQGLTQRLIKIEELYAPNALES